MLLHMQDADVLHFIDEHKEVKQQREMEIVGIGRSKLYIAQSVGLRNDELQQKLSDFSAVIDLSSRPLDGALDGHEDESNLPAILQVPIPEGKRGSRVLRLELPRLVKFYDIHRQSSRSLLIMCDSGSDFSVGVALAILALYFGDDGAWLNEKNTQRMDKELIRTRLTYIILHKNVNPSRTTLQAVNSFLMG